MYSYNYCKISFYTLATLFSYQKKCHGSRAHQGAKPKDYRISLLLELNYKQELEHSMYLQVPPLSWHLA